MRSSACLLKTRRLAVTGSVLLHCVGDVRFSNHLNVYAHRPAQLGLCQATQLSTTHLLRHLSCQRDRHVRCEGEQKQRMWRDVGTRFFKDTREWCMGTFVDSPQCGGGRDHLKSGSSTEDDLSLQLGDEPRPGAVFLKAVIVSVFERRSAPHDQRRAVACACRSSTLVIYFL